MTGQPDSEPVAAGAAAASESGTVTVALSSLEPSCLLEADSDSEVGGFEIPPGPGQSRSGPVTDRKNPGPGHSGPVTDRNNYLNFRAHSTVPRCDIMMTRTR